MTRGDRLIGRASAVGIVVLLASGAWMTGVSGMVPEPGERQPAPAARPFSERMGCPPWAEGLSRTVTVIATEDAAGGITSLQCVRVRERGVLRKVG